MPEFLINGGPNDDPGSWIKHLLIESKRLGEHVREEGQRTQDKFTDLREDFHACNDTIRADLAATKVDLLAKIAELEQKHAVSATELRLKVTGLTILTSSITTVIWWFVQHAWGG